MLRSVLVVLTVSMGLLTAPQVSAQTICSERDNFIKHLSKNHKEAPSLMGLSSNGSVVEVLTANNGSWTIIVTNPEGVACVVAAGEAWQQVAQQE